MTAARAKPQVTGPDEFRHPQAARRSSQRPNRADHASAKPQVTTPDVFFGAHTVTEHLNAFPAPKSGSTR